MGGPENLLVGLYRLAHRPQENFLTESFAHLLRHLLRDDPDSGKRVLTWLVGEGVLLGAAADGPLRVGTQLATDGFGIPDIRIESEVVDVIVEVKLDSGITFEQVDAYRRGLEEQNRERRALVALLGYQPTAELPRETEIRTWRELGSVLSEEVADSGSEVTRHLVEQFVGLLNHLHLMPLRVRSRVSEGLLKHRAWADANPSLPSVTRTRLRSLRHLEGMSGCQALFDLLMQMQHVVSQAEGVSSYRFDSGPVGAWPWIGFNVNDMEFFFFLSLDNPETVTVQRYGEGIDPESFDGTLGELEHRRNGLVYWFHSVDLADPAVGFFEVGRAEQVQVLAEIFETGFRFGRSLQSSTSSPERAETSTGSVDPAESEVV